MDARAAMRRRTRQMLGSYESPGERRVRAETRAALALAQIVYDRRTALGLTKDDVASRSDTDVALIAGIEGAAPLPPVPVLRRIGEALGGRIVVDHDSGEEPVTFVADGTRRRDEGVPMHGIDRFVVCASESREAALWARERGVPVESYSVVPGCQGVRGLRGYSDVVFVVLPGYWRTVPRGEAADTSQVFDNLVNRQESPFTKVLDDGDMSVSYSGTTDKVMRLLWALYPRGRCAPDRG